MFEEICKIELGDDVTFSFRSIGEKCEGDEYIGIEFRYLQIIQVVLKTKI